MGVHRLESSIEVIVKIAYFQFIVPLYFRDDRSSKLVVVFQVVCFPPHTCLYDVRLQDRDLSTLLNSSRQHCVLLYLRDIALQVHHRPQQRQSQILAWRCFGRHVRSIKFRARLQSLHMFVKIIWVQYGPVIGEWWLIYDEKRTYPIGRPVVIWPNRTIWTKAREVAALSWTMIV